MKSKTYFGEYSLSHWLKLMIKRNIILPDYQRSFVWNHQDIERLVKSFKAGQFIQPVTIARLNSVGNGINIILDGQQRLTSILLLALGFFPRKDRFKEAPQMASDDDTVEEDDTNLSNKIIEWTFERMFKTDLNLNTLAEIRHRISNDDHYETLRFKNKKLQLTGDDLNDFLENTYLGFSYIVPDQSNAEEEQIFFSTLFRHMNYLGQKLSPLESRKALYYLNEDYKNFFEGKLSDGSEALGGLKIMDKGIHRSIDLVRYLSALSQYDEVSSSVKKIMVGYSSFSSREHYYGDFVSYIVGSDQDGRDDKFNGFSMKTTFGDEGWMPRFERLQQTISVLSDNMDLDSKNTETFKSWIDADYWLFGLIYWIVFKNKEITTDSDWSSEIKEEIANKKIEPNSSYVKSPNMLGHLRERIKRSIELIKPHIT